MCVAGATPADADTHTPPSLPLSKKKNGKKSDPVEAFPRLTEEQVAVYHILTIYFPSLGTPASRVEFARFLQEPGIEFSTWGAVLVCAWLEANERNFPFMRLTLFRQILDEFNAQPDEDLEVAEQLAWYPCNEKMSKLTAIHDEWNEKYGKAKGAAK